MENPPFLITDKRFWGCPVHVFGAATMFVVGVTFGVLLMLFSHPQGSIGSGSPSGYHCEVRHD